MRRLLRPQISSQIITARRRDDEATRWVASRECVGGGVAILRRYLAHATARGACGGRVRWVEGWGGLPSEIDTLRSSSAFEPRARVLSSRHSSHERISSGGRSFRRREPRIGYYT